MPVIATAGHVDHGKSTLIEALTGRDPDRWAEERERGLTIDLGFAWATIGEHRIGFVDVPGHERFVKNMLAGVDGIGAALFVVAADEGWMPQSEEHLAVLDLIGVRRAVIALTRVDLVDDDTVELTTLEVGEHLEGTTLEGAEIVPVSAPSDRGLDVLREHLAALVQPEVDLGRPRLWIDRSFAVGGVGTVVTGTLTDGTLAVGDELLVHPGVRQVRVRGLQSHEETVEVVGPGTRTAVNLVGIDHHEVGRGAMLGAPGHWRPTTQLLVDLRTVRSLDAPVRSRGSFHLHAGSASTPVRLRLLESDPLEETGAAIVTMREPLSLAAGDRIVIREVGRRSVVAGGRVLDPAPARRSRAVAATVPVLRAATSADERAEALLSVRAVEKKTTLAADSGGGSASEASLDAGEFLMSQAEYLRLEEAAVDELERFHTENPLRAGMGRSELATRLETPAAVADRVLDVSADLATTGPDAHLARFEPQIDAHSGTEWDRVRAMLQEARFAPPRRKDLPLDRELVHALLREGALVAVSDDLLYLPDTLEELASETREMQDGFTVADFRDELQITRKHAVPLLEWLDRSGVTRRQGDGRTIRR